MGCVPSKRALAIRAAALKEGDKMSEYSDYYRKVKTTKGDMISLAQFEGKKDVVLFFYPKADTPPGAPRRPASSATSTTPSPPPGPK